ncbi:MAG TPA: hypothetical protein ENI87_09520 [bacterium]|nr:hypothetical protein [bacterium]
MSKNKRWEITIVATLCTILGLVSGRAITSGPAEHAGTEPAEAGGAHGVHLPPATLANLGVRVEPVQTTTYYQTVSMAAIVVDTPTTEQPVYAPIGGRIESIDVRRGTAIDPGRTVITMVRDPLPRPQLILTADALRPAQEQLHQNVLELRKAAEEVRIASTELARIEQFTGKVGDRDLPIIPRQRAIDLRYQLSRFQKAREQARLELKKHGLSDAQIDAVEGGAPLPEFDDQTWQRALARNGLWPRQAQELSAALPKELRALPWVTATIGELAASGLATPELTEWVSSFGVAKHFLDIGVLLQRGYTLADLKRLHALNALEPIVRITAPDLEQAVIEEGAPEEGGRWDVLEILTKRGATVAAGERLLTLSDPRRLYLRTEPVGQEVGAILVAAKEGHAITARPLIRSSGPDLDKLRVSFIQPSNDNAGTIAYVEVDNWVQSEIANGNGRAARTWALRSGTRYLLHVPTVKHENVFVLPSAAVTEDGPNKVVFLQDGDSFKSVPIEIAYQDDEVVVIPTTKNIALFPGDPVVQYGAFELGMAMKGSDPADAHAGHNH